MNKNKKQWNSNKLMKKYQNHAKSNAISMSIISINGNGNQKQNSIKKKSNCQ